MGRAGWAWGCDWRRFALWEGWCSEERACVRTCECLWLYMAVHTCVGTCVCVHTYVTACVCTCACV